MSLHNLSTTQLLAAVAIVLLSGFQPSGVEAAEPMALRGLALAHACAACHGPDGRSQGAIPPIDALPAADFVAALKAFRSDATQGTVMNRITKGLDEAEIDAVAAYFASRHGVHR